MNNEYESKEIELKKLMDEIASTKRSGYVNFPMPCRLDDVILRLADLFLSIPEAERAPFREKLNTQEFSDTLLAFSQRMAVLGVREKSQNRLFYGLIAHAIEGCQDGRENVLILSLLNNSAQKIGIDPIALFDKAAAYANEKTSELLRRYVRKPPQNKTIAAMEFVEVDGPSGFNYKRAPQKW